MEKTGTVQAKRFFIHQQSKKILTSLTKDPTIEKPIAVDKSESVHTSTTEHKSPPKREPPRPPPPTSSADESKSKTSKTETTKTIIKNKKPLVPKTRIVVVRTTAAPENQEQPSVEENKKDSGRSVNITPALTDGKTSVYLIRRPIPPPGPPLETKFYQRATDDTETIVTSTTTTSKNSRNRRRNRPISSPATTEESEGELNSSKRSKSRRNSSLSHVRSQSMRNNDDGSEDDDDEIEGGQKKRRISNYLRPKPIPRNVQPEKPIRKVNREIQVEDTSESNHRTLNKNRIQPSTKNSREDSFESDEIDEEQSNKLENCLLCLSKHICLVIIICTIIFLLGLIGSAVSIYFLTADSNSQTAAKIIGIVLGLLIAIAALIFLFTIMTCVGSCEAYFTFHGEGPRQGGKTFSVGKNSKKTTESYQELEETRTTAASSPSTVTSFPKKNITIEMPANLLTGRELSPKSHRRKMNKVVENIGQVVNNASKRYPGDVPDKVIVRVDSGGKETV